MSINLQSPLILLMPRVLLHDLLYFAFIGRPVPSEHVVGFGLRRRFGVRVVEEFLDTDQNLLDRDGGSPGLFLVQDRKTDSAGGIDVRVEKWRVEFA